MTSRQYTYAEASAASRKFGRALLSQVGFLLTDVFSSKKSFGVFELQGFQKEDVMGILLPNCTSYVLGLLGGMEVGLTVTTLNPAYTTPEIARQLEMSKAKVILTEESRVLQVKEAMTQIGNFYHLNGDPFLGSVLSHFFHLILREKPYNHSGLRCASKSRTIKYG